jgi:hypothetical protein
MTIEERADSRLTVVVARMKDVQDAIKVGASETTIDFHTEAAHAFIKSWLPHIIETLGMKEVHRQMGWLAKNS